MSTVNDFHDNAVDDSPKLRLLAPTALEAASQAGQFRPAWCLKRLRPAHLSVAILTLLTICLASCAPLVPDLVREKSHPSVSQPANGPTLTQDAGLHHRSTAVTRLLSLAGQCVREVVGTADGPGSNASSSSVVTAVGLFRCRTGPLPDCSELPAMCRYRTVLLACQIITPASLAVCLALLAVATFAARRLALQCRLLLAALAFALGALVATIAFVVCLHLLVGELAPAPSPSLSRVYSADSAGARLAYAGVCLQTVLACQLVCLPMGLRRVAKERADLLGRLLG